MYKYRVCTFQLPVLVYQSSYSTAHFEFQTFYILWKYIYENFYAAITSCMTDIIKSKYHGYRVYSTKLAQLPTNKETLDFLLHNFI